jgi:hypothetical protein
MRLSVPKPLLLIAATIVGCAGLSADPLEDPAGAGSTTFGAGTLGEKCAPASEGCQWLASECSSEPGCANWYQCMMGKPASSNLLVQADVCAAGGLTAYQNKIVECLLKTDGCESSKAVGPEPDAGPAEYGDANAWPGLNDAEVDESGLYDSCEACMTQECHALPGALEVCYGFKVYIVKCSSLQDQNDPKAQLKQEACLYQKVTVNSAHGTWASSGAVELAYTACSPKCQAQPYQPCIDCQKKSCRDALDAFAASTDAQNYQWCRSNCDIVANTGAVDPAECKNKCLADHKAGYSIVGALLGCRFESCSAECSGQP